MENQKLDSINNIVVGVDFSKYSRVVFKQAHSLAKNFKAKLHVVYVSEDPIYLASPVLYSNAFRYVAPTTEEIVSTVERIYNVKISADIAIIAREGVVYKNILQVAKQLKNPLIVVGSVGHGAFSRFLLGSQAEQLALKSPYPVWVHRGSQIKMFKNVLVPVDFSESAQNVVNLFKKISSKLKLNLDYLYIQSETYPFLDYDTYVSFQKEMQNRLREFMTKFQKQNPKIKIKVKIGDAAEEIVKIGKKYDVIVMSPHNRSGLFKSFGRVTSKVVRLANSPVLIIT